MLRKASLFLVLPLLLVGASIARVSADGCPAGTVAITDSTRATATAAGIPRTAECWSPNDAITGVAAGDAKLWLQQHATKGSNISCLNPQFAEKLKVFMEAVPGGIPTIISGYRTPESQNAKVASGVSKLGPCQTYHNYGLAADFNAGSQTLTWMRVNAPHYGLAPTGVNPQTGCASSGFCDAGHIQNGGEKTGQCGACSNYQGDGTLPNPPSNGLPFDQQVRQALGVPPPPPPPMQQQPVQPLQSLTQPQPTQTGASSTPPSIDTLNSTPYPAGTCAPKTYCSQTDGNIYYRATTCVDQLYQKCASGCGGLICNATSTDANNSQLGGLFSPDITNNNSNTNSNSNGSSTFDLIDFFANPIIATTIGTATPIDITNAVQNTDNASVLQPSATSSKPIQTPPQGSNAGYGPVPQQTFTSGDLANTSGGYGSQGSTFQIALDNMRATLLGILNYLQPFGGRIGPTPGYFGE